MVLGIYWYFGFPEGLYSYKYFKWKPGFGGHANNPAELETTVSCTNSEALIEALKALIQELPHGFIYIYQNNDQLKIGTGSFALHDFDFEMMTRAELILENYQVQVIDDFNTKDSNLIKLCVKKNSATVQYQDLKVLKPVSSDMKKYNAESSLLRLDVNNVLQKEKDAFLKELEKISEEENLKVLMYKECSFEGSINLMLFFGNGRQGCNFKEKQYVDAERLENKIMALNNEFDIEYQFKGGWDYYPKGDHTILKITDEEFII